MDVQTEGSDNQVAEVVDNTQLEDSGNLPSMREEQANTLDKFKIDDEFAAKNFKDGKLYGRFDSMEAVLNTLHAVETKYSNVMREMKNGEKAEAQAPQASIAEVAQPIINKYVENGFSYDGMDTEISEVAEATGKSVAEIKLHAIEIKEKISSAYETVGGKDEYHAMLAWGKENLSEADSKSFDADLGTSMSKYAIKGLYDEYKKATSSGEEPQQRGRIEGDGSGKTGVRPYASMAEIARDKAYLNGKGKFDAGAKAAHARRMALTPDSVIFGR